MPLHQLIPFLMIGVMLVGIVAALFGWSRTVAGALIAIPALFVLSLWFPEPVTPESERLHGSASFLFLFLTLPVLAATALIAALVRWAIANLRRRL